MKNFFFKRYDNSNGRGRFFKVRNTLNIVFLIGAVIGLYFYFFDSEETGKVIILASIFIKFIERILRIFR